MPFERNVLASFEAPPATARKSSPDAGYTWDGKNVKKSNHMKSKNDSLILLLLRLDDELY